MHMALGFGASTNQSEAAAKGSAERKKLESALDAAKKMTAGRAATEATATASRALAAYDAKNGR